MPDWTAHHKSNYAPRGGYLAFLGRIAPEKRPDRAIQIAQPLGIHLKIAAKVDKADESYFRDQIAPLLSSRRISAATMRPTDRSARSWVSPRANER